MKIDFYILNDADKQKSLIFTCSLIEKIYKANHIYVQTSSKEAADYFDNLLWIYREDSFLPHHIYDERNEFPIPIEIGFGSILPQHKQTLINLETNIPNAYDAFNYMIEIVFSDALVQQSARERYKTYREQGHELNIYKENITI